jgi:hypothetical protein
MGSNCQKCSLDGEKRCASRVVNVFPVPEFEFEFEFMVGPITQNCDCLPIPVPKFWRGKQIGGAIASSSEILGATGPIQACASQPRRDRMNGEPRSPSSFIHRHPPRSTLLVHLSISIWRRLASMRSFGDLRIDHPKCIRKGIIQTKFLFWNSRYGSCGSAMR